ncbi:hypothetical protein LEP1GSC052_0425 [Leptospira kmetyi serovar Malaysia str. Bejo-Iso9]|nr:hypothetical protein LEP1GSC052_0425 [Leptospira kmetyi serovar Malaysia str. Bejo-Iso9]
MADYAGTQYSDLLSFHVVSPETIFKDSSGNDQTGFIDSAFIFICDPTDKTDNIDPDREIYENICFLNRDGLYLDSLIRSARSGL